MCDIRGAWLAVLDVCDMNAFLGKNFVWIYGEFHTKRINDSTIILCLEPETRFDRPKRGSIS